MSQQLMPVVSIQGGDDDLAGRAAITKDIYTLSWRDLDGDIEQDSVGGVSRNTAGFTTVLLTGDGTNRTYINDKVQGGAKGAEIIFSLVAEKSIDRGGLTLRAWSAPTEGTSVGATLIGEFKGPAASSGVGFVTNVIFGQLGINEYLLLEWVSADLGAPAASITQIALVKRG